MIVALAFCAKNKEITVRLMQWLSELGWLDKHDCLLGVHADTDSSGVLDVAQRIFRRAAEFTIDDPETIYPFIANVMWKRCAMHIADMNESAPWFWLEPDAVPLVPEWLDWIEAEYKRAGKPFLLDRVVTPNSTHNSGTGVYPARVRDYTHQLWNLSNVPWDVFFKDDFTPHTMHTTLIHDKFYAVWDDPKSGEPTFPDAASLAQIESGAVIFHRNKDGSLIARLRESRGNKVFREANVAAQVADITDERAPKILRLVDLRGFDAERISALTLAEDEKPTRLQSVTVGTPHWQAAPYEIRKVEASEIPGIGAGDSVLFSRCAKDGACPEKALLKRIDETLRPKKPVKPKRTAVQQAAIDARMAGLRARKKKLTGVV